jgi:hypothetical protein
MTPFHINTSTKKISSLYNSLNGDEQQNWNNDYMHYFLLYAIQKNDYSLLDWLLTKGGDPNTDDLILICLKNDYEECLKVLIRHGADPNNINPINITLVESRVHIDSGGVLFADNIMGLLYDKYNPIEICIINTLYNSKIKYTVKQDIINKYLNSLENKNEIKVLFEKIINIKVITDISRNIQKVVKDVIHMCE